MVMKVILNINTNIEINNLGDLKKLKIVVEANGLNRPNYMELARQLGVDRRTIKKYYERDGVPVPRKKENQRLIIMKR